MSLRAVVGEVREDKSIGSLVVEFRPSKPPAELKLPKLDFGIIVGLMSAERAAFMLAFPCEEVGIDGPTFEETTELAAIICSATGLDPSHAFHLSTMAGLVAYDNGDRIVRYPIVDAELLLARVIPLLTTYGEEPDCAALVIDELEAGPQWQPSV